MTARSCGECQACCEAIGVYFAKDDFEKPPFQRCEHQCEAGCAIYENRPRPCRVFNCTWILGWGREQDRPDKLGLVIEQRDELIIVSEGRPNAHKEKRAEKVLRKFAKDRTRPTVLIPYGPPGSRDFLVAEGWTTEEVMERLKKWYLRENYLRCPPEAFDV